jgi:Mg2+ and Co2+ transporter CorA
VRLPSPQLTRAVKTDVGDFAAKVLSYLATCEKPRNPVENTRFIENLRVILRNVVMFLAAARGQRTIHEQEIDSLGTVRARFLRQRQDLLAQTARRVRAEPVTTIMPRAPDPFLELIKDKDVAITEAKTAVTNIDAVVEQLEEGRRKITNILGGEGNDGDTASSSTGSVA